MASKNNFTSLKEVYDYLAASEDRPERLTFRGQEFTETPWGLVYLGDLVEGKIRDQIEFRPDKKFVAYCVHPDGIEWYSALDIISEDNIKVVLKDVIRQLMTDDKFWLHTYEEVTFSEAIRNNIKDAVELWDYIRSSNIRILNPRPIGQI